MKKFTLFTVLLSTFLQAENFDTFIGAEIGNTKMRVEPNISESGTSFGGRIGFIRETGRVFISANSAGIDSADLNTVLVNFDAITPRAYRFNDSFAIRGFVGVHGGYAQLKPSQSLVSDDEGIAGGGQAGILFDFPANITLEAGYKASWASLDYGTVPVKNYQNAYLAFDFIF